MDGVPLKEKDYKTFIDTKIINDDLFKIISNPLYFPNMDWKKQRIQLLDLIGDIDDLDVINSNPDLLDLKNIMDDGIDNLFAKTKSIIKKLNENIKSIPFRIDECNNAIIDVDVEKINAERNEINAIINKLEMQSTDDDASNAKKELEYKIERLEITRNELKKQLELKVGTLNVRHTNLVDDCGFIENNIVKLKQYNDTLKTKIESCNERISGHEKDLADLRELYIAEQKIKYEFDESDGICGTCGREFEHDKIEEIKSHAIKKFEFARIKTLERLSKQGHQTNERIVLEQKEIERIQIELQTNDARINELNSDLKEIRQHIEDLKDKKSSIDTSGIEDLNVQITSAKYELESFKNRGNTNPLMDDVNALYAKRDALDAQLHQDVTNNNMKKRIVELENEERQIAIEIAKSEKILYICESFIKTKVAMLENKINEQFDGAIKFKLFNQQVNGGIAECCEPLIDGVPFKDANTASKINGGLSIIKAICKHNDIHAPIFLDNRESTNEIIPMDGNQIINLKVSNHNELVVEE